MTNSSVDSSAWEPLFKTARRLLRRSSKPLEASGRCGCCGRASRRRPLPPASGTQAVARFAGRGTGGIECGL